MRNARASAAFHRVVGRGLFWIGLLALLVACAPVPAAVGVPLDPASAPSSIPLPLAGGRGDEKVAAAPTVPPRAAPEGRSAPAAAAFPYAAQSQWLPTQVNFDWGREGARPQFIVIHYTAISYERTLRAFNNPNSHVSAHYVIRGDGHVAQLVGEADTAWHAGNYWYNERAIGIELELDAVTNPQFTDQQYKAAAALSCAIAARQGIPLDRAHVIGHNEVPWPNDHSDPGPTWSWPHFMWLTSLCAPPTAQTVRAAFVDESAFPELAVGQSAEVHVSLRNTGATAWRKGTSQEARLAIPGNDRSYEFLADGWPTADRVAAQNEDMVPPGGTATFTFRVRGTRPGIFKLPLRGVIDGGAWMDDSGIYVQVTVKERARSGLGPSGRDR